MDGFASSLPGLIPGYSVNISGESLSLSKAFGFSRMMRCSFCSIRGTLLGVTRLIAIAMGFSNFFYVPVPFSFTVRIDTFHDPRVGSFLILGLSLLWLCRIGSQNHDVGFDRCPHRIPRHRSERVQPGKIQSTKRSGLQRPLATLLPLPACLELLEPRSPYLVTCCV